MNGIVKVFSVFVVLFCCSRANADYSGPELKMPVPGGYKWMINTVPGSYLTHTGNDYYSIDFDDDLEGDGESDLGEGVVDVLAAASGTVVSTTKSADGCGVGSISCTVIIDHGWGIKTKYMHLHSGSIRVSKDDWIPQGTVIGKIGNSGTQTTGPHLHFQVLSGDNSSQNNAGLTNVRVDGIKMVDYHVDEFTSSISTNRLYNYDGSFQVCKGPVTGGVSPDYIFTCNNPVSTFKKGDYPILLVSITNIKGYADHKFRYKVYRDGALWCTKYGPQNNVSQWGWGRATHYDDIPNLQPGFHEVKIELKIGGFWQEINAVNFNVPVPPPYEYDGNGVTCRGPVTGSADTNWLYTCQNPSTLFGCEMIYHLVRINNVTKNHKFKIVTYRNGTYQWQWQMPNWNVVGEWGWQYAHFWPENKCPLPGSWRADIYAIIEGESGSCFLKSLYYTVW